jgi:hypothetical protein
LIGNRYEPLTHQVFLRDVSLTVGHPATARSNYYRNNTGDDKPKCPDRCTARFDYSCCDGGDRFSSLGFYSGGTGSKPIKKDERYTQDDQAADQDGKDNYSTLGEKPFKRPLVFVIHVGLKQFSRNC